MLESQWIADRDGELSNLQRGGVAESYRRRMAGRNPHDREVRVRIVADGICPHAVSVDVADADLTCTMHDVAVGQQQTIRREQKSGACTVPRALSIRLCDLEVHHRRCHTPRRRNDGLRVGIEESRVGGLDRRARFACAWHGGVEFRIEIENG